MIDLPSLHVRLTVLLRSRIIELERAQTSTRHEQECDILDVLNILRVYVLDDMSVTLYRDTTRSCIRQRS